MKIAFVTQPGHKVLPAAGSLEIWTWEVARRLAERHDVTIYASGASDQEADADGIRYRLLAHGHAGFVQRVIRLLYRVLPKRRAYFSSVWHPFPYWLRVGLALRRMQPDVVHVMNYSQAIPIMRRLVPGARLVLHMQCEWLNQLDRSMIARRLRHADLIVGCSDHITSKVAVRFPDHADRCQTIFNGVAADDLGDVARHPEKDRDTVRLLNLGRVSPEKGIHVLVDAFNELVRDMPRLELIVVGDDAVVPIEMAVAIDDDPLVRALARFYDGDYPAEMRARLTPEAARQATFVGRVEYAEILRFYRESDVFVFPSIFESFAIPPVEAMAAGLPVVATRVGGMKETVVHGQTGLLVEREDPAALAAGVRRLIEDPDLRRSFGEAGRARAAELFAWPRIAAEVEAAFRALVTPGPALAPSSVGAVGVE